VIYQALTGRRAVQADDFGDLVLEVLHARPPLASSLIPGVPHDVDAYLLCALAKRPDDRPTSLRDWATSLAEQLDGMSSDVVGWLSEAGELDLTMCSRKKASADAPP